MTALIAHRDQCSAAAAAGVPGAGDRLRNAESYVYMLGLSDTPEIGGLFVMFAEDNARRAGR